MTIDLGDSPPPKIRIPIVSGGTQCVHPVCLSRLYITPQHPEPRPNQRSINVESFQAHYPSRADQLRALTGDSIQSLVTPQRSGYGFVKALVRWATGKRLTNRLPKLSLITLSPPLNSGILGLRMGLYVPTPKFFYNLWGPRESDSSDS